MKKVFFLIAITGSFSCFSQLDSTVATVSFTSEIDSTFLDSINVPADFMSVNIWVNDPVSTGDIMVSVYESQTGHPMARVHWDIAEIQTRNPQNENNITVPIGFLDANLSYMIDVVVKNTQNTELPEYSFSFP